VDSAVKVACAQVEPVALDLAKTLDKLEAVAKEAAANGAALVVLPEAFIPAYPSNRWVRYLAAGADATPVYARLARESITVPGPDSERLGAIAREAGIWLATGANELERGTIYNALLVYAPDGSLALHHRKLMPTNHERLVWGSAPATGSRRSRPISAVSAG
jgi:nitrilase